MKSKITNYSPNLESIMKKLLLLSLAVVFILASVTTKALTPFWYNWYAIDNTGQLLPNESTTLNVRIKIIQGSTIVYQELHSGISSDQFAIYSVNVGNGSVESGTLSSITTTAATRIQAEVQKQTGPFVFVNSVGLASVQVNNTVLPGDITLAQDKILIGNSAGEAEAQSIGGDLSGSNTGSLASLTIVNNAVTSSKILDRAVTYAKLQDASASGLVLVSNASNEWVESSLATLETDPIWTAAEPNYGHLGQNETITGNWVNTANPWADDEVADNLTIVGGTVNNTPIGAALASTGAFTTLAASSTVTFSGLTASAQPNVLVVDNAGVVYKSPNSGSFTNIIEVSTNYTAQLTDGTILVDCAAGHVTISLPTAAAGNKGLKLQIKKIDNTVNSLIIAPVSGTIDGQANRTTIVPNQGFVVQSSGTKWFVVGTF